MDAGLYENDANPFSAVPSLVGSGLGNRIQHWSNKVFVFIKKNSKRRKAKTGWCVSYGIECQQNAGFSVILALLKPDVPV